jgi:hypothetical protein
MLAGPSVPHDGLRSERTAASFDSDSAIAPDSASAVDEVRLAAFSSEEAGTSEPSESLEASPSAAPAANGLPKNPVGPPVAKHDDVPDETLLKSCEGRRWIVVHKAARRLELYCGDALAARYNASLGFAPDGHKEREGDGRTPEGEYFVILKYASQFHRSLQISYPNVADAEVGLARGRINASQYESIVRANRACSNPPQNTPLGSLIQIHGGGGGAEAGDWTLGCVAVDNPEIERVYLFHKPGCDNEGRPMTRVVILP